ncbi:hypothetical protein C3B54_111414 [Pontimonas salivibrio]|uniref:Uncharacterized protein n=1 Tax=Pontimonas salivibrio TaxID=1159327 RepID=A0A2L2BRV0_9MICO|nr:hypothetical protein C3B54_111414 [Pontimonas salivibrio]
MALGNGDTPLSVGQRRTEASYLPSPEFEKGPSGRGATAACDTAQSYFVGVSVEVYTGAL